MDENFIINRGVTRKQLATEIYYITDAIMDTAEEMNKTLDAQPSNPAEINENDLLVDIAGWAARIKALAGIVRDNAFQLMD